MIGPCRSWRRFRAAIVEVHPGTDVAALPGIVACGFTMPVRHEGE